MLYTAYTHTHTHTRLGWGREERKGDKVIITGKQTTENPLHKICLWGFHLESFPRWNLKLDRGQGGQGETPEEAEGSRLVAGSFNKQGNLHTTCLGQPQNE